MTDVDRALAALTDELNILAGVYHVGRGQLEAVRAAADRYALTYLRAAHQLACHSPCLTPGSCKFDGLFARLEGGGHDAV